MLFCSNMWFTGLLEDNFEDGSGLRAQVLCSTDWITQKGSVCSKFCATLSTLKGEVHMICPLSMKTAALQYEADAEMQSCKAVLRIWSLQPKVIYSDTVHLHKALQHKQSVKQYTTHTRYTDLWLRLPVPWPCPQQSPCLVLPILQHYLFQNQISKTGLPSHSMLWNFVLIAQHLLTFLPDLTNRTCMQHRHSLSSACLHIVEWGARFATGCFKRAANLFQDWLQVSHRLLTSWSSLHEESACTIFLILATPMTIHRIWCVRWANCEKASTLRIGPE